MPINRQALTADTGEMLKMVGKGCPNIKGGQMRTQLKERSELSCLSEFDPALSKLTQRHYGARKGWI